MATLKIPTLLHAARLCKETPELTQREFIKIFYSKIPFNYNPLVAGMRDMMLWGIPYETVAQGIIRKEKRQKVADNFLEALPLMQEYVDSISPHHIQEMPRVYYPLSHDLRIPFSSPLVYQQNNQLHIPSFIFWKTNPLTEEQKSLLATIIDDLFLDDPDFENANFQIVDFSKPAKKEDRELLITNTKEIPRLTQSEKNRKLENLVQGFHLAEAEIANARPSQEKNRPQPESYSKDQYTLFLE